MLMSMVKCNSGVLGENYVIHECSKGGRTIDTLQFYFFGEYPRVSAKIH